MITNRLGDAMPEYGRMTWPLYVRRTWPFPLAVTVIIAVLAAIGTTRELSAEKLNDLIQQALGTGLGAWGVALLIVWVARTMGRLQDDAGSTRAVWLVGLVFLVFFFVDASKMFGTR